MAKKKITKMSAKKSAPRKSATRTSVKPSSQVQSHVISDKFKSLKIRKSYIILIVIMFALGALLYYGRGLFVAAVVNGQPISRVAIVKETEKQAGKQALDNIVRNTLIEQEARKKGVTVSQKEIDDEIKKVEATLSKQGQKLSDVLVMQNMTKEDLQKLIRLDKLVGKIVGKDIKVTDKEISDYLEKNKEMLPKDQTEEQLKKTVSEQLKQQKLNEKVQAWLTELKSKAKILYFVQY